MKRVVSVLLAALLLCSVLSTALAQDLWGLAIDNLATRSGPGTSYKDTGKYMVKGQYIKVLSRAYDKPNGIWWVKCEIPYHGEIRVLWTGYKRFDKSSLPLETIPVEGEQAPVTPVPVTAPPVTAPPQNGGQGWQAAYRQLISSGMYGYYLYNPNAEFNGMLQSRERAYDCFLLHDLDRDGIPELLVLTQFGPEQADVFAWNGTDAVWTGRMGGDNFFQYFLYYPSYPSAGLITLTGGPAMNIEAYRLSGLALQKTYVGGTSVDSEGMETTGIHMNVSDNTLYGLLYGTLVSGGDTAVYLDGWVPLSQLNNGNWQLLFH